MYFSMYTDMSVNFLSNNMNSMFLDSKNILKLGKRKWSPKQHVHESGIIVLLLQMDSVCVSAVNKIITVGACNETKCPPPPPTETEGMVGWLDG